MNLQNSCLARGRQLCYSHKHGDEVAQQAFPPKVLNKKGTNVVVYSLQCAYSYILLVQRQTTHTERNKQIYQLICREVEQSAIYKSNRGVELGSTTKQHQLSGT